MFKYFLPPFMKFACNIIISLPLQPEKLFSRFWTTTDEIAVRLRFYFRRCCSNVIVVRRTIVREILGGKVS